MAPSRGVAAWRPTLTTTQLAEFVSSGVLRFDALVPQELNARVLDELPSVLERKLGAFVGESVSEGPATGVRLSQCYEGTALGEVLALPQIRGLVSSLVGRDPFFDHDFAHFLPAGHGVRQHLHADAIVDTADPSFDIQLFYFPHDVAENTGGTIYVPGTHLRRVPSTSIARYQNVAGQQRFVGPAGTVLVFHHGLWHAGPKNPASEPRWMYKIRLNPAVPQTRLWDLTDFESTHNDPSDHVFATSRSDSVAGILRQTFPWQGIDAARYDLTERVKLWRYLSGDATFDADHYLTRLARPLASSEVAND